MRFRWLYAAFGREMQPLNTNSLVSRLPYDVGCVRRLNRIYATGT
jgi:hypothetical protein